MRNENRPKPQVRRGLQRSFPVFLLPGSRTPLPEWPAREAEMAESPSPGRHGTRKEWLPAPVPGRFVPWWFLFSSDRRRTILISQTEEPLRKCSNPGSR